MAKPDNRNDNVEHLQQAVQNTLQNLDEAQEYLQLHGDEIPNQERENIEDKNARRIESVESFRNEIHDEAHQQQK